MIGRVAFPPTRPDGPVSSQSVHRKQPNYKMNINSKQQLSSFYGRRKLATTVPAGIFGRCRCPRQLLLPRRQCLRCQLCIDCTRPCPPSSEANSWDRTCCPLALVGFVPAKERASWTLTGRGGGDRWTDRCLRDHGRIELLRRVAVLGGVRALRLRRGRPSPSSTRPYGEKEST